MARVLTPSDLFSRAGLIADHYRGVDWSRTPLGPPASWPPSLTTALSICLGNPSPSAISWGPELTLLYNAPFAQMIGHKHPSALGRPHAEVFWENADVMMPLIEQVMRTGAGRQHADVLLPIDRQGDVEESYFSYTREPLWDDAAEIVGVLAVATDVTQRLRAERRTAETDDRLRLLQRLTQRLAATLTEHQIASVLIEEVMPLLGARVANIVRRQGDWVERISEATLPEPLDQVWRRPVGAAIPACQAVASGRELILRSDAERRQSYPGEAWVELFAGFGPVVAFPLVVGGAALGSVSLAFPPERSLSEDDVAMLRTLADQCATALERARLIEAQRSQAAALSAAVAQARALQTVCAQLASASTTEQIAEVVLRSGLGSASANGWVAMVTGPAGAALRTWSLLPTASASVTGITRAHAATSSDHPLGRALCRGEVQVGTDGAGAVIVAAPVRAGGRVVGAVGVDVAGAPTPDLTAFLTTLADVMGQAWERARLYEQNLRIARVLQDALIPTVPKIPGLEIAGFYRPGDLAAEVGGDWYEVIDIGPDRTGLVIGDVMGHDIRAAAVMGQLRGALRCYVDLGFSPGEVLTRLNAHVERLAGAELVTCVYAVYEHRRRRLTAASAGHLPPIMVTRGHGPDDVRPLPVPPDPPLGAGVRRFGETVVGVPAGALVAFFTDGLVEVRGVDLDERLALFGRYLAAAGPDADLEALARESGVAMTTGTRVSGEDDFTLLLLRTPIGHR